MAARIVRDGARGEAPVAAVLVHGRDQDASYLREHLVGRLARPDVAYLLPETPKRTWYAGRFTDTVEELEPDLSDGLRAVQTAVEEAARTAHAVVLAGFSQGACLVAELLARRGPSRRLVGAAVLTGALIGRRAREDEVRELPVDLAGVSVEMVSSAYDDWVPPVFVRATAEALIGAGADVRLQITQEAEHRIDDVALAAVRRLLDRARQQAAGRS